MKFAQASCEQFIQVLATKEPVPGGGGASALVGAVGTALGNMVGSLTVGKKKYAAVQDDIVSLKVRADKLQGELLALMQRDAEVFAPLAAAYGLPKETDEQRAEKERVMEVCLKSCCEVPLQIMRACAQAIDLHEEFAAKGSVIAISDVGVGVAFCRAALLGASLNVFINTKAMKDGEFAQRANREADELIAAYTAKADAIYEGVLGRLR